MSPLTQLLRYYELNSRQGCGSALSPHDLLAMEALGAGLHAQSSLPVSSPISGMLSTQDIEHCVRVVRIGVDGVVCTGCPGALPVGTMGLRLDDPCESQSYLFRVAVSWIDHLDPEEDSEVGFDFMGPPVVLSWGRGRTSPPQAVIEVESKLAA